METTAAYAGARFSHPSEAAMSARTDTSTRPLPTHVDTRLPWWALALPVAAFAALLLLIAGPGGAQATADDPGVGRVLQQLQQTLAP
ncbi:hypothetical protein GCM10010230_12160 [Streptomyces narbonensis]|nr:hypothetical protein GCM10010230_12160 [Streptomyces narbonensis]